MDVATHSPTPRVSVIVPVRNGAAWLGPQLEALLGQEIDEPWELLVVDNGSTDGTGEVIRQFAAQDRRVRLVTEPRPGTNIARNAGVAAARGEVFCFCDADDLVAPGWLRALAGAALSGRDGAGAFGGVEEFAKLNPPDAVLPGRERSPGLVRYLGFLPVLTGANFAVRRDAYVRAGPFDESYSGGGDDTAYAWQLQCAGVSIAFVPDAVVHVRLRQRARDVFRTRYRAGISHPHLYRDFRNAGMRRRGLRAIVRSYAHLVLRAPWYARTRSYRLEWVGMIAVALGRIRGSLRYRTWYL